MPDTPQQPPLEAAHLVAAPVEPPAVESPALEAPALEAPLDPRLLEILVCPLTKGPLEYDRAAGELAYAGHGIIH